MSLTTAFVVVTRPSSTPTTNNGGRYLISSARPALKNSNSSSNNIESFLNKAKLELEKLVNPNNTDNNKEIKVATSVHQDDKDDSYHKGGNARYQDPVMRPSKLDTEEYDDCEETIIDFATGDELCWGESSPLKQPTKNYNVNVVATATNTAMQYDVLHHDLKATRDEYHKGGNAHYRAESPPKLLKDILGEDGECDEQDRFIDFATGDELCWAD